jgi:hypothetical protein
VLVESAVSVEMARDRKLKQEEAQSRRTGVCGRHSLAATMPAGYPDI